MKIKNSFLQAAALAACSVFLAMFAIAQPPSPQSSLSPTPKAALLILSKQDHTIAIVDPATLRVVARIPVGDDPHEVVASTDGHASAFRDREIRDSISVEVGDTDRGGGKRQARDSSSGRRQQGIEL